MPLEELEDEDRYVLVEPEESGRAYRDMEEFTETVREATLRRRRRCRPARFSAKRCEQRILALVPLTL